jgi:putative DNA-invertase from lambdoid prophage Rac
MNVMYRDLEIEKPRQVVGDARAYKGRKPSYSRKSQFESAQAMLGKSARVGEVARTIGLTRQTIYRIKDDPAGAEAAFATWGM